MAVAEVSIEQLRDAVARRHMAPVYLVIGAEATLRRRAFETLRQAFVDEAGAEMPGSVSRVEFSAEEDAIDAVLDEARSLSLFAMSATGVARLVWASGGDKLEKADDLASLQRYLEAPVTSTCLVIEAAAMDRRRTVFKMLSTHATLVECDAPKSEEAVRRWIGSLVTNRGYQIEADAVVLLLEMAGTAVTILEQELDKAMLFVGEPGGTIRASDLEGLLGRSRERSVFELTDALVDGDAVAATAVLNALVDDGEDPVRLLSMIAWITRQLVVAHDVGARLPEREAMEALGGRWEQRKSLLRRARRGSRAALLRALQACAEADERVKRLRDSRLGADRLRPARGALEALCRQICAA